MPTRSAQADFSTNKVIGLFLLIGAVAITLVVSHPPLALRFSVYILFGFSIALLLIKTRSEAQISFKARNISASVIGGAAIPLALILYDPIGKFTNLETDRLVGATVFVHGKRGAMDMILRQKGHVIMELNGDRQRKPISENGDAHFENLRVGDKVRLDIDFSEPYRAVKRDSVYTIDKTGKIYLQVALEGVDMITGMVLHDDQPLEGVIIKTGTLIDTTSSTGDFTINVPEEYQQQRYQVWFVKSGFKTKSAPAYPQTGDPLIIVMEKAN